MGSPPDVRRGRRTQDPDTSRRRCRIVRAAAARRSRGGLHDGMHQRPASTDPDRARSRTRPARSRSSGSRTRTSPGWSSATSTPRAACSAGRSSSRSRTAPPTTRSPPTPRPGSSQAAGRRRLRRHLQLDPPGDQGPGGRRGPDALPLSRAVRGTGVRPADLLHRSGARAAGRPVHPVADGARRERRRSTCPRPTTSGRTC